MPRIRWIIIAWLILMAGVACSGSSTETEAVRDDDADPREGSDGAPPPPQAEETGETAAATPGVEPEPLDDDPAPETTTDCDDCCESGSWSVALVDDEPGVGTYPALALGSHDRWHLTYQVGTNLRYARPTEAGGWEFETADLGGIGAYTSLAVDGANRVHVGVQVGNVAYASRASADEWSREDIIPASPLEYTGFANSLVIDADDTRHMSFFLMDAETHDPSVVYAHGPTGGELEIELVAAAGNAADYSAIALGEDGSIHLVWSSYEYRPGLVSLASVYYGTREPTGSWDIELVASEARLGKFQPTLALDSDGSPHLAYAGRGSGPATVWYAHRPTEIWEIESIDSGGLELPDVAVDTDGTVHVSYYHAALERVRYARRTPTGWVTEDFTTGPTNFPNSLAVGRDGTVHVSFSASGIHYAARCP